VEAVVAAAGVDVAEADAGVAADSRRMPGPVRQRMLQAPIRAADAAAADTAAVAGAGDAGGAAHPSEHFQHLY
jgi:hypothetical protein